MKLVVYTRDTYLPERRFAFDLILGEWLGFDYEHRFHERPDVVVELAGDEAERRLAVPDVLFSVESEDWRSERSMPHLPLQRCPLPPLDGCARDPLPIVFGEPWSAEGPWRLTDDGVALGIDVFGSSFFLLSRYEELVRPDRDTHGRFPLGASLAQAEGFVERPVVDEYVDVLWAAMKSIWPQVRRPAQTFRLRLTHDVDHPFAAYGVPFRSVARSAMGDLSRRRDAGMAARRIRAVYDARRCRVDRDPYNTFDFLMDTGERHGLSATFFFMAGESRVGPDDDYRLKDPPVANLLRQVHERGHEIGLHASYDSIRSPDATRAEFEALGEACSSLGVSEPKGVRQHFLRFEYPQTWRNHEAAGIDLDYTLGFAEHVGFRSGTCREHPVFDVLDRRTLGVRERPLTIMDRTLTGYMGLDPSDAAARTRALVDTCRRFGGEAVLLHHNTSLTHEAERAWYRDVVAEIVQAR